MVDFFIGLVALFNYFFYFNNILFFILITLFYFIIIFSFFLSFLPFLPSHETDRVLVLWMGVRHEPLRWKSRVQDTGPPETSWTHVTSIGKSSPRDLHLNAKTQLHSMTSKLQCWTPHAKQLARQEYKLTH